MKKIPKIYVSPIMTVAESDKMAGEKLTIANCHRIFTGDVDLYDKETGNCLAMFRKNVIPGDVVNDAFISLLPAAKPTSNRGLATGKKDKKNTTDRVVLKSGKISKTFRAHATVNSGIVGYFDRDSRFPNCRLTSFNRYEFEKFKTAYPIIKLVSDMYGKLLPDHYARQKAIVDKTSKDFVIKDTVFTTVSVNKNFQTAVHKDAGDYREGFGNLTVLRKGTFSGGYLVLIRWGVGFDLHNCDVLMMDVHQWHANTPIHYHDPKAIRMSLVMFYRENMIKCGTMAEELKRVQNLKIKERVIDKVRKIYGKKTK